MRLFNSNVTNRASRAAMIIGLIAATTALMTATPPGSDRDKHSPVQLDYDRKHAHGTRRVKRDGTNFSKECITNEEIGRISPDVVSSGSSVIAYLKAYGSTFCSPSKQPIEDVYQVLCSFYDCLVDAYISDFEYPHQRCLKLYPSQQSLEKSVKFYTKLRNVKWEYQNVDIKIYFSSIIQLEGQFFCTHKKIRSCYTDKKSQYIYSFYKWKKSIIQHWYQQFYTPDYDPNKSNPLLPRFRMPQPDIPFSEYLNFKAIIATLVAFIIATLLGTVNILVVKEVLNESKDACSRLFHFYETILDLIQSLISLITSLNIDEYLVILWSDLCYTPPFSYSKSNKPQVGRLLAWGVLFSNQNMYRWLAQDRFIAMKYPLQYNNRGPQHIKKAKKKIYCISVGGILLAVFEIIVHQLFLHQVLEKYHYCSSSKSYVPVDIYLIVEFIIEFFNWFTIVTIVCGQYYYSISALVAWYKFNKDMVIENACPELTEESATELAKTKQKFVLLVGTCILNFICLTPWLVLGFFNLFKLFPIVEKISRCLALDQIHKAFQKMRIAMSFDGHLERNIRSIWPTFIVLNCFSVIVHICAGKTYRNAVIRVYKKIKKKNEAKVHVLSNRNNNVDNEQ